MSAVALLTSGVKHAGTLARGTTSALWTGAGVAMAATVAFTAFDWADSSYIATKKNRKARRKARR